MADLVFDPTQGCPVIKNFNCVQEDCSFWNAKRVECIFWDEMAGHDKYTEVAQLLVGVLTDEIVNLGAVYKDLSIFVDQVCNIRFHDATHPSISMSTALARVGIPVYFKGINAQYVLVTTTVNTNITVDGNG
jgi:hypothetical protein